MRLVSLNSSFRRCVSATESASGWTGYLAPLSLAAFMSFSTTEVLYADDNNLSVDQIFTNARKAYESMTTYSDEGQIVSSVFGQTFITNFKIRLGRPNFYRIECTHPTSLFPGIPSLDVANISWSDGTGHFVNTGGVRKNVIDPKLEQLYPMPEEKRSRVNLDTGLTQAGTTEIPNIFFAFPTVFSRWETISDAEEKREADEKIGDVDCYVFSNSSNFRRTILWIGKQDFLIRQIKQNQTPEDHAAAMNDLMKKHPNSNVDLRGLVSSHGTEWTETHNNIVVNQPMVPKDFTP